MRSVLLRYTTNKTGLVFDAICTNFDAMINCARRAALRGISQRVFAPCRGMVDIAQKERGEEAAYIHRKEHERAEQAQLRKSMEEILSRKDGDEQKTKLKEIIGNYICAMLYF